MKIQNCQPRYYALINCSDEYDYRLVKSTTLFDPKRNTLKGLVRHSRLRVKYSIIPVLHILYQVPNQKGSENRITSNKDKGLNLEVGDWVEVRSEEEISATLDSKGRCKGLSFMPEMKKFCNGKYKVIKKVNRIVLESTGEIRTMARPAIYLEGVHCDGEFHERCDRLCYLMWRDDWLKRTASD